MTDQNRYDWVLFDQGGTLFEPLPGCYSERHQRLAVAELGAATLAQQPQVASVFRQARRDADAHAIKTRFYPHRQLVTEHLVRGLIALELFPDSVLEDFLKLGALPLSLRPVVSRYCARQEDVVVNQLRLKPGCHELFGWLHGKARMAIASNNSEANLQPLIRRFRLNHFLQASLTSDELGACKPSPDFFRKTFEALGLSQVQAPRVLYVGDTVEFDVAAAHSFGLDVALIAADQSGDGDATYCFGSLAELRDLFT